MNYELWSLAVHNSALVQFIFFLLSSGIQIHPYEHFFSEHLRLSALKLDSLDLEPS